MTDWKLIHDRLTTEQGRINGDVALLTVGRQAFRILFYAVIMLVEEKMK